MMGISCPMASRVLYERSLFPPCSYLRRCWWEQDSPTKQGTLFLAFPSACRAVAQRVIDSLRSATCGRNSRNCRETAALSRSRTKPRVSARTTRHPPSPIFMQGCFDCLYWATAKTSRGLSRGPGHQ